MLGGAITHLQESRISRSKHRKRRGRNKLYCRSIAYAHAKKMWFYPLFVQNVAFFNETNLHSSVDKKECMKLEW